MYHNGRCQFLTYLVLPTDSGEAPSQAGGGARGFVTVQGASWMQALCAEELCTMDKGMKGMVSVQLCLEGQLENGAFPTQVGRWDAREYW